MKYEEIHKDRMSNDIFRDVLITKQLMQSLIGVSTELNISTQKLNGYIQDISLDPFGFLLISELQVKFFTFKTFDNLIYLF